MGPSGCYRPIRAQSRVRAAPEPGQGGHCHPAPLHSAGEKQADQGENSGGLPTTGKAARDLDKRAVLTLPNTLGTLPALHLCPRCSCAGTAPCLESSPVRPPLTSHFKNHLLQPRLQPELSSRPSVPHRCFPWQWSRMPAVLLVGILYGQDAALQHSEHRVLHTASVW